MDVLFVKKIRIGIFSIEIEFERTGRWKEFINTEKFICEFNKKIDTSSEAIAAVPFLGNILPIAWYFDLQINVDDLDKNFYNSLTDILDGYKKMYPSIKFGGYLKVNHLVDTGSKVPQKEACFFSGGVDAYYTLLRNRKEISAITTVWGADIFLNDEQGWNNVLYHLEAVTNEFDVELYTIKSNFREMLNNTALNKALNYKGWNWWHEFQHGMGLITLMAPLAEVDNLCKIFIASSYTADVKNLTCASDPSIDNQVKFSACKVIHDGFESNRQEKIKYIVNASENCRVNLRVCWTTRGGKNCCTCEKCCRTITAIYLEGGNPSEMGFDNKKAEFKEVAVNMKYRNTGLSRDWDLIQERMQEIYSENNVPNYWKWFYKGGTKAINNNFAFLCLHFILRIINKFKRRGI